MHYGYYGKTIDKMKKIISILFIAFFVACSVSNEQEYVLEELNSKYTDYKFSSLNEITGLYMKVEMKKGFELDSNEVRGIYEFCETEMDKLLKGDEGKLSWEYLVFYNENGEYLYTVTRGVGESNISFFRDGTN